MKNLQPIGIFDSGVGGLGIFKKIKELLPNEDIIYFADNKNLPFGEKSVEELQKITTDILNFLIEKHNIKMAVVACNTASTTCLEYLRSKFSIPIIGVVPVVKPACELSKIKKVAILATTATANSDYQKELIKKFANGVQVINIPCPDLVILVDSGEISSPRVIEKLKEYLLPAIDNNVDVIGLACTHFPFLKEQIKKLVPDNVAILDSNDAVAKQAVRILSTFALEQIADKTHDPKYVFYASKDTDEFNEIAKKLVGDVC